MVVLSSLRKVEVRGVAQSPSCISKEPVIGVMVELMHSLRRLRPRRMPMCEGCGAECRVQVQAHGHGLMGMEMETLIGALVHGEAPSLCVTN